MDEREWKRIVADLRKNVTEAPGEWHRYTNASAGKDLLIKTTHPKSELKLINHPEHGCPLPTPWKHAGRWTRPRPPVRDYGYGLKYYEIAKPSDRWPMAHYRHAVPVRKDLE